MPFFSYKSSAWFLVAMQAVTVFGIEEMDIFAAQSQLEHISTT
jgi:hypothetical protein